MRHLSPSNVIAALALFVALGGTAWALATDSVKSKHIVDDAVKSADLKDDGVKSADLKDETVTGDDLADPEPFQRVGAPGAPPFSDGGEGDCDWRFLGAEHPVNPLGFYKDPLDLVHLVGGLESTSAPGGDATCDPTEVGELEDGIVFTLPTGYRPENTTRVGVTDDFAAIVVGDEDITLGGEVIPAGTVMATSVVSEPRIWVDGASFRAAGPGTEPIDLEDLS
jgi:hypothetical protein